MEDALEQANLHCLTGGKSDNAAKLNPDNSIDDNVFHDVTQPLIMDMKVNA